MRYGPKQLVESRHRQAVLLISPSYILRTHREEYMPLGSSDEPGPPTLKWVLWWAVQKQHSQRLMPNFNYTVHLNSLTRKAGTMMSILAEMISTEINNLK